MRGLESFFLSMKFEPCLGLRVLINMFYENAPRWIREIPGHFKTQEMCNETVAQFSYTLRYVPDHLKTQKVCNQAVRNNPAVIFLFPDRFKTQELCIKALEVDP